MIDRSHFVELLNRRDLPGVGVIVYYNNGNKIYYFYEDFSSTDTGISRAEKAFSKMIANGKITRIEYIHKNHKTIHFWDWNNKPDEFCANDEFIHFNKCFGFDYFYSAQRFISIINGLQYKYDYTPSIDGISAIVAERLNR